MKLIYITGSLPYGSAEPFSISEIDGLRNLGFDVTVVPTSPRGRVIHVDEAWLEQVVTERFISPRILDVALRHLAASRADLRKVLVLVRRSRNLGVLGKNCAVLAKGIWLARLAQDIGAHHIHANWASTPATVGLIASELSGLPWSFSAHRWDITEDNLFGLKVHRARFVRFISESGRAAAMAAGNLTYAQKAVVVHMGVKLPVYEDLNFERDLTRSLPIVFCAAHLYTVKAHADLIKAMRILHDRQIDCELWIAGDGPLRNRLRRLVKSLNLGKRVRWLGQLAHSQILELYREGAVTCTALASLNEGIPVSLMEAMSYGVPVVATKVGGITELLGGGCGIIVPPRDPAALADGIAKVVSNQALHNSLAREGRLRIEAEYSVERNTASLSKLFTEAHSKQPRGSMLCPI